MIDGSESTSVLPTDEVEKKRRVDGGADKEVMKRAAKSLCCQTELIAQFVKNSGIIISLFLLEGEVSLWWY